MTRKKHKTKKVKVHEFETLQKLVDLLESNEVELPIQENFFYAFKIQQISKEFDLLKIDKGNFVLNIELKSEFVGETQELYQYTDGNHR